MSEAGSRRLWDWRFVLSIAVLLAVAFIIYSSFTGQRDSARKSDQIARLVAQNAEDTQRFTVNQEHLLADEHVMLGYTAALANRQNEILSYLSRHGIHIPRHLLRPIAPPTLTHEGQVMPSKSDPSGKPTPSSTPRPSPSPAAPAPGGAVSPSPKVPAPTRGQAPARPQHQRPHPTPSGPSTGSSRH